MLTHLRLLKPIRWHLSKPIGLRLLKRIRWHLSKPIGLRLLRHFHLR